MNPTDPESAAAAPPRRRRWRWAVLGLALLLAAYQAFSSLAFEPLLRWAATRWLAAHGGHRLVLAQAQWQPWQLALDVRGLSLQGPDGAPLLDLRSARVDLELGSLWQRAVVVTQLDLDQPVLHWHTRADGRSNWGDLLQALSGPAPAAGADSAPVRWWLRQASLRDGQLQWRDASLPGGFKAQLDALTIDAQDLATLPGLQGRHTLSLRSEIGATVRGTGTLALQPVQAEGTLALEGLALDRLAPLLKPWIDTSPLSGQAGATLAYRARVDAGRVALKLSDLRVQGQGLGWLDRSATPPLNAAVQQLALQGSADLALGAGPLTLQLGGLGLQLSGLQVSAQGDAQPWVELSTLRTQEGRLSWPERQLDLGPITLAQGRVQLRRDAQGGLPIVQALQARIAAASAGAASAPAAAASAPAWSWRAGPGRLNDVTVSWQDDTLRPAAAAAVTAVDGEVGALSHEPDSQAAARLQLQLASGGRVDLRGQLAPGRRSATLDLQVDDLALAPAAPYVAQASALALADGRAALRGQLQVDGTQWRYRGSLGVQRLRLNERSTGERLLGWDLLASDQVQADAAQLRVGELALRGLGGRFTIFADGSTNVARVLKRPGRPAPTHAASQPAYAVAVDRIKVSQGTVDFADLSLALPFGARIEDLGGQIVGIGTAPGAQAQLALEGRVAPAGLARVNGRLRPFDPQADTDLKLLFRNVEMTTLTPYAATFAGRRIRSGTLSLDLQYRIEQGRLRGDNHVVMDRLQLGDKVSAPGTRDLPLDLAVALLQDANGRIDLGLPVSGSLQDPQFALGPLLWKALSTVLLKAATAPFKALASLAGGQDGPPLDRIDFDPGRVDLTPPEREKLARVAQALQSRDTLVLTVQPPLDPQADGEALRGQALRRAVAAASGRQVPADEDPGPIEPSQPATQAALQRLYAQRFGKPAPADTQDLLKPLRDAQVLPDAALQTLARQRAEAIRDELARQGLGGPRVQLQEPAAPRAPAPGLGATLAIQAQGELAVSAPAPAPR